MNFRERREREAEKQAKEKMDRERQRKERERREREERTRRPEWADGGADMQLVNQHFEDSFRYANQKKVSTVYIS